MKASLFQLFASCVMTLAALPAPAQEARTNVAVVDESAWHEVKTEDGELSVRMSARPDVYVRDGEFYVGRGEVEVKRLEVYAAYREDAVFLVYQYKLSDPQKLMKNLVRRVTSDAGGRAQRTAVVLGGLSGTQLAYQNASAYHVTQVYTGRKVLYEIAAYARDKNHPDLQPFFASARLGGESAAGVTAAVAPAQTDGPASRAAAPGQGIRKAVIVFRPEPQFTTLARMNNVGGLVRLRLLLTSSGRVSNVSVVQALPDGLTEQAVAAAQHIAFLPAYKDGRRVSQWVTVEYNFNVY